MITIIKPITDITLPGSSPNRPAKLRVDSGKVWQKTQWKKDYAVYWAYGTEGTQYNCAGKPIGKGIVDRRPMSFKPPCDEAYPVEQLGVYYWACKCDECLKRKQLEYVRATD